MRKRPLLILMGGCILLLALLLSVKSENGLTRWLYGRHREKAGSGGVFRVEARIESVRKTTGGMRAVIRIQNGALKHVRAEGLWADADSALPGVCFRAQLTMEQPEQASNPGQFDAWLYYKTRGIDYLFTADEVQLTEVRQGLTTWLAKGRQAAEKALYSMLPDREAGLTAAILLGSSGIEPETKELFQKIGIAHIFAISGLHIMLLCGWTLRGMSRLLGKRKGAAVGLVMLWLYTALTGGAVSTLRAAIMTSIREAGVLLYREEDPVITVVLSAFILLIKQPLYLLDAGFQLSFGAVLSLRFLTPVFQRWYRIPAELRKIAAPSLAVSIGTGPLTLWHFYQLCPYSLLVNLAVIPLMNIVLLFAALTCGLAGLWPAAARFCAGPVYYILRFYQYLGERIGRWPGSQWNPGRPGVLAMIGFYGMLILLIGIGYQTAAWRRTFMRRGGYLLLGLCLILLWPISKQQVTFLDIGQGDCAVIERNGHVYIVDAGPRYEAVLRPYLRYTGARHIEAVFLSHYDQDHAEGVRKLLLDEEITVKQLFIPPGPAPDSWKPVFEKSRGKGTQVLPLAAGTTAREDGAMFDCLWPDPAALPESSNDASMVVVWEAEGIRVLFTGDIETEAERALQEKNIRANILKVAHHGSRSSSGEEFLRAVQPQLAVISARKAAYGHPHPETLERLQKTGIAYKITEETGAITVHIRRRSLRWKTYKK